MDCLLVLPYNTTPPNLAEKTFVNSHKTLKFGKVFSLESFPRYGSLVSRFVCLFVCSQLHLLLLCNCKIRIDNKAVLHVSGFFLSFYFIFYFNTTNMLRVHYIYTLVLQATPFTEREEGSGHAATTELLLRNAIIEHSG